MKPIVYLIKKTEILSALAIRLVYLTGKSKVPIHPKHLIREDSDTWYKNLLNKKMVVLDAGCGSGQHSNQIARFVKLVIGIDNNEESLKIAKADAKNKEIKNVSFFKGNLEHKLFLKNKSCDFAILFDVLEHIKRRQFFLREIIRVLKNKGMAIVVIPNQDTSWKRLQRKYGIFSYSDPDHKIEYTKESITNELTQAKFKIKRIIPISFDTPWVGFIDLVGGISLRLYKKLSVWKKKMLRLRPEDCSGFQIVAVKSI